MAEASCSSSLTGSDWQKNLVRVFHPVIVEQLSEPSRLLPHLGQLIKMDKMRAIRTKERANPADAVEMLLDCLLSSTELDWFTIFKEALQKTKYMVLYKKLCLEDVKNTEKYEDLLKCNLNKLTDNVHDVTGIIVYLCQHDVITVNDMRQIEAEKSSKGSCDAMLYLLLTLPCRHEDWFYHLINALKQNGYHQLISEIHPDLTKAESLESMDRVITGMPQLKDSTGSCYRQPNPLHVPIKGNGADSVNRETVPKRIWSPVSTPVSSMVTAVKQPAIESTSAHIIASKSWQTGIRRRSLDASVCEDGGDGEESGEFDFRSTVGEEEFERNRLAEVSLHSDLSTRAGGHAVTTPSLTSVVMGTGWNQTPSSHETGNTNTGRSRAPDVENRNELSPSGVAATSRSGAGFQYAPPPVGQYAAPIDSSRRINAPTIRQSVPTAASCPTVIHQHPINDVTNSPVNRHPLLTTSPQAVQSAANDCFDVRCSKCNVLALRSSAIHVIQGSHHVVMDDSFTQRIKEEPHYSPKSFGPWDKTHKISCKDCHQDWGIKGTYKRLPCYVVKSNAFKFIRGGLCYTGKSWESIKVPFAEFSRDDLGILKRRAGTSTNFAYNSY